VRIAEKNKNSISRKAITLMEKMKKNSRNILAWIQRISIVIFMKDQRGKTKKEKLWSFELVDECYGEMVQDLWKLRLAAALRKEIQSLVSRLPISFYQRI